MSASFRLHAADDVHCTATWRNLFFVVWRAAPTVDRVQAFGPVLRALLDGNPDGIGFLVLMRAERPIPEQEVRAAAAVHFKAMGARCRFQMVVYERPGVVVGLLRATLRAFSVLSASHRVFLVTTLAEAVGQGAPLLRVEPKEMNAAIEEILDRYEQRLDRQRDR